MGIQEAFKSQRIQFGISNKNLEKCSFTSVFIPESADFKTNSDCDNCKYRKIFTGLIFFCCKTKYK